MHLLLSWTRSTEPPIFLGFRSSRNFIIAVCCVASFSDMFLYGVILPVIPFALTSRVGISPDDVQRWTSTLLGCYAAGLVVAAPVCGWLADNSPSRRLPLVFGLLALAGSTVLLCFGSCIGVLIVGRLLEGLSGAIIWTAVPALLVDTFGQKNIGKIMGYCSVSLSLGVLFGPLLGGIVFTKSGYYWVFAMSFGIISLDIPLRLALVEKKIAEKWTIPRRQHQGQYWICDYDANGLPIIAPSPLMEAVLAGTKDASHSGPPIENESHFSTGNALSHARNNLPPIISLLRSPRVLAALWGGFVQATVAFAFDSVLPLFVSRTFGWGSTGAGLVYLPLIIPTFAAPLIGWCGDRYGPKWPAASAFLLALPILVLLRVVTHRSTEQAVLLCILLALLGLSLATQLISLMTEVTHLVEAREKEHPHIVVKTGVYGQAYGLFFSSLALGALIGPLWGGFIEERGGWGVMSWSFGLLSGLTAIPVLFVTGGFISVGGRKRRSEVA